MPICRFYQRGICRNGTACRFSHNSDSDSAVPKKTTAKDRIDNYRDAAVFVRRLNGHKNIDFCLSEVWRLKERLNSYIRDFDDFELNALFSLLTKCMEAFDKQQFDEVIRTLSASLVVATPDYVEDIRTMNQMLACMKILVEVGRVDSKAAALIPADKFCEQAKLIGASEEPLLMPLQRIEFYKSGGAVRNIQARRGAAGGGLTDLSSDEEAECESLMHEFNLMPTLDEIKDNVRPTKLKSKLVNRASSKWDANKPSDVLLYRATHYYCLRQEFLIPLKEALSFSLGFATATGAPAKAMCYEHVKAIPQPFGVTNTGDPYVQVAFTCQRPVDFTLGSHLIYGSLVALFRTTTGTPRGDADPESLVFATVVQFDVRETGGQRSEAGTVGIGFDETNFYKFQFDAEYCMLESPDYFLAKKPVFDFLRDADVFQEMPLLQKLLGDVTPHDEAPLYLQGARIDLAPLYTGDGPTAVESDPLGPWPTVSGRRIELDPAQQTAMRHILRRPIAVVQGPPGTGKSYLGVKFARLARAALDRKDYEEPMLAVTLTNHALDQFLEDLLPYMPGQIVRFGGRSKADNEALQECQVRARMRENSEDYQRRQDFKDQLESTCRTLNSVAALYQGGDAQLVCILAYIPFTLFQRIIAPMGWKMSFARLGHFAAEFAMESLRNWLEGTERQMAGNEKAWLKQRGFEIKGKVKTSNRFDPGRSSRGYETFDVLSDRQRKDLRDEMEAGVDRLIDHLFEFGTPTGRNQELDLDELDMDLLDLIEQERVVGEQIFADRAGRRAAFGGLEIDGVLRGRGANLAVPRPSNDNVDDLEIDRPWRDEHTMAACFQQKIRGRLETTFGETVVAAGCHVAVHDAGTTCVNQAAPSRRSRQGLVEAVGTALEGPMKAKLRDIYKKGEDAAKAYMQHRKAVLFRACRGSKLIGMTSTYAALNRDLVHRLAPRVVIIEEAGELLECQLISSLSSPKLEHVVLIGDHQQLRPKINAFELCRKNHFDISLFERLINLNVPFAKLSTQLRMRPEVSQLVKHFYTDGLIDHERVKKYDRVGGVATDVYFIDHRELEHSFEGTSKRNEFEAKFAVGVAAYLVRTQQYKPRDITLLTPYIGQKRLMRNHLNVDLRSDKKRGVEGVQVVSIDDYQGEENKVIILSLVRSNASKRIGFVGIENRVIVALSRAREGLYIIGNSEMFEKAASWKTVIQMLKDQGRLGPVLTLMCRNHLDNREPVSKAEDFAKVKDGGCRQPCDKLLPRCGHRCYLNCHVFSHDQVMCKQKCNRPAPDGCSHFRPSHDCATCGGGSPSPIDVCTYSCKRLIMVDLPCGHEKQVRCYLQTDAKERICRTLVKVALPCGHEKQVRCYLREDQDERKCLTMLPATLPCGHSQKTPCHMFSNLKEVKCSTAVEITRDCGHAYKTPCHKRDVAPRQHCKEMVEIVATCGHKRSVECGLKTVEESKLCQTQVKVTLPCGHSRNCPCHRALQVQSQQCEKQATVTLPCGHEQVVKCWQSKKDLSVITCTFNQKVVAPCRHQVQKNCKKVADCEKKCEKKLDCGHACEKFCRLPHDHGKVICKKDCRKGLLCGHLCDNKCGSHDKLCSEGCGLKCLHGAVCRKRCDEECDPCTKACAWECRHHKCNKPCNEPCDRPRCNAECDIKLRCGHSCSGVCGEPCPVCPKCSPEVKCRLSKKNIGQAVKSGSKLYLLPDCGHTFVLHSLDKYIDKRSGPTWLPRCPSCKGRIQTSPRYGKIVKEAIAQLTYVKTMLHKEANPGIPKTCVFATARWSACRCGNVQAVTSGNIPFPCSRCTSMKEAEDSADAPKKVSQIGVLAHGGGNCRNGTACRFSHSPESLAGNPSKRPDIACKLYQQGNCRYGASCKFSHGARNVHQRTAVRIEEKLTSVSAVNIFLRRLKDRGDIDMQLTQLFNVREKLREYMNQLEHDDLVIIVGLLDDVKDAFDHQKYKDLLRALSATLIISTSSDYITKQKADVDFLKYLSLAVEIGRNDSRCLRLLPMEDVRTRAKELKGDSEQAAKIYVEQIEFHLTGRSTEKLRQRTAHNGEAGVLEACEQGECEELMLEEMLLPSLDEISGRLPRSTLRPKLVNRLTERWDSTNDLLLYKTMHYYCLRQEFLVPLKDALWPVITKTPSTNGARTVCYERVSASDMPFDISNTGDPYVEVSFRCTRPIDFTLGSHLIFGSLVALFQTSTGTLEGEPDQHTLIYATVAQFNIHKVGGQRSRGGKVGLSFDADTLKRFDFNAQYCMLESPDYFLAKKPVFDFLRSERSLSRIPLLSQLLGRIEEPQQPPLYLRDKKIDLSLLYCKGDDKKDSIMGDPLEDWPEIEGRKIELDEAQQLAMKHILRSPVAIVQGPPGTGKSYLGVKFARIARACLKNRMLFGDPRSTILTVTLTNHALDQFLEDILPHFGNCGVVRFGGRSKSQSPALQQCNARYKAKETKEEYLGRKEFKRSLERCSRALNAALFLQHSEQARLVCILAYLPCSIFWTIVRPRGWQVSFALLGRSACAFVLMSLDHWLKGEERKLPGVEQSWLEDRNLPYSRDEDLFSATDRGNVPTIFSYRSKSARRYLCSQMKSGVKTCLDNVFSHYQDIPRDTWRNVDIGGLDMDILDRINEERIMFDDAFDDYDVEEEYRPIRRPAPERFVFGFDSDSDSDEFSDDEEEPVRISRPESDDVRHELAREPWQTEEMMAAVLQQEIRRELEKIFGAKNIAENCHVPIHDMAKRIGSNPRDRWQLMETVEPRLNRSMTVKLQEMYSKCKRRGEAYAQHRKALSLRACSGASLVGMTSTFAALNRDVLERLAPKVVIIEEAGELLECQLMACLSSPKLEHVVLIGDHQQLRPKINAFELCRKNHFDISLFERLINLNVPFAKLSTQLRMRPEVSQLVKHFYTDGLIDHERVKKYDRVGGVDTDVYFIDHREFEQSSEGSSKRNEFEAKYAVALATYLVRSQQYKPSDITLLSPYVGQKRLIRTLLSPELRSTRAASENDIKVVTIDDYQGEENKIIILSLVRSNAGGRIGFIGIENRVIVALSRAREGLYILGNSKTIEKSPSWEKVIESLRSQGRLGQSLILKCRNHPENTEDITNTDAFNNVKDGGCREPCQKLLPRCGHRCPLLCHVFDHNSVKCERTCNRPKPLNCTHQRPEHLCASCDRLGLTPQDCCEYRCREEVEVVLDCGHQKHVACFLQDSSSARHCTTIVDIELPCGHSNEVECHAKEDPDSRRCKAPVEITRPCNHKIEVPCFKKDNLAACSEKVDVELPCGHKKTIPCEKKDFSFYRQCSEEVVVDLECGHQTKVRCVNKNSRCCEETIELTLECGHTKSIRCNDRKSLSAKRCLNHVLVELPCGHKKLIECWRRVSLGDIDCNEKAEITLPCGHKNSTLCYLKDRPSHYSHRCEEPVEITLPCGHTGKTACHLKDSSRSTLRSSFPLSSRSCCVEVPVTLGCGHENMVPCHSKDKTASIKCQVSVTSKLTCGHDREVRCGTDAKTKGSPCQTEVSVELRCGHRQLVPCHTVQEIFEAVFHKVSRDGYGMCTLACGHKVSVLNGFVKEVTYDSQKSIVPCDKFQHGKVVSRCTYTKTDEALCGHKIVVNCNSTPHCQKTCEFPFKCGHKCGRPCFPYHDHGEVPCLEPCQTELLCGHICDQACGLPHTQLCKRGCERRCPHRQQCEKTCYEACPPCKESCAWRCPHYQCHRLCGEVCDRPRCDEPCSLTLDCGHSCQGVCGELCPLCPICHPNIRCILTGEDIGLAAKAESRLYELPECGHIFFVEALDRYMGAIDGKPSSLKARRCPVCQEIINIAPRYNSILNARRSTLERINCALSQNIQTDQPMVSNCWSVCPHGHVSMVDTLPATSDCPTCLAGAK